MSAVAPPGAIAPSAADLPADASSYAANSDVARALPDRGAVRAAVVAGSLTLLCLAVLVVAVPA